MRLVRSAMAVMHLRLQPEPARISGPCRTAEARPATERNTTFTCTAATRATLRHADAARWPLRSEEHTSELQSLMRISYAVFRLKKKQITHMHYEHEKHDLYTHKHQN